MKGDYADAVDLFADRKIRKRKKGWTKTHIKGHLNKLAVKHFSKEDEDRIVEYFKTTNDFHEGPHYFCEGFHFADARARESLVYVLTLRDGTRVVRDENINREGGCIQPIQNTFLYKLVHCGATFQCMSTSNGRIYYNAPFQFLYY